MTTRPHWEILSDGALVVSARGQRITFEVGEAQAELIAAAPALLAALRKMVMHAEAPSGVQDHAAMRAAHVALDLATGRGEPHGVTHIDDSRKSAADTLLQAAHAFWKSERRAGMPGAVRWLQGDDGSLVVFTRGEYRAALLKNIDEGLPEHRFEPVPAPAPPAHAPRLRWRHTQPQAAEGAGTVCLDAGTECDGVIAWERVPMAPYDAPMTEPAA